MTGLPATTLRRVLITGGGGFLGAWIARRLLARGVGVRIFDRQDRREFLASIAGGATEVQWQIGDVRSASDLRQAFAGCDGVIHLAAMLTPECSQDPIRGAEVNLIGSLQVFALAREMGLRQVVYASTAGVFGPDDGGHPEPATHYGVFKLAVEGAARAAWREQGLASIGLRPYVVYGPGRESGLSAGPSLACRAAVRGESFQLGFSGAVGLVYVDDLAAIFEQAVLASIEGAQVFNIAGSTHTMAEVVDEIRRQWPEARLRVDGPALTIPEHLDESAIDDWLPTRQRTSLRAGISATLEHYARETASHE